MEMVAESVRLMESDQTKIFNLGYKMVFGSHYMDRVAAEGELLRFVTDMVRKVAHRKTLCPGYPDNCVNLTKEVSSEQAVAGGVG